MAVIEGRWDCSQCDNTNIPGRFKACPECHDPRNQALTPKERVYFPDQTSVTDTDLLDLAEAGPDWNCGHCGTANRGDAKACTGCSRLLGSDDTVGRRTTYLGGHLADGVKFSDPAIPADDIIEDELDRAERVLTGDAETPRRLEDLTLPESELSRSRVEVDLLDQDASASGHPRKLLIAGASALIILLLSGVVWLIIQATSTEPIDLKVSALTWERRIDIEEYRTLTEEDWRIPRGGRQLESFREIHHYDKVLDRYERVAYPVSKRVSDGYDTISEPCGTRTVDDSNGFGHVETQYCSRQVERFHTETDIKYRQEPVYRDEPVYRTKYRYEIDRWVFDRWVTRSGGTSNLDSKPVWPRVEVTGANQRVGSRREGTYLVSLRSKTGRTYREATSLRIWRRLEPGEKVVGHVRHDGGLSSVSWPTS